MLEMLFAAAKNWPSALIPATTTVSVKMVPFTLDPSPYLIAKLPGWGLDVLDLEGSYRCFNLQIGVWHSVEGSQRSEEPVSKSITKD